MANYNYFRSFFALFEIILSLLEILCLLNENNDLKSSSNNVLIAYSNNKI